MGIIGIIGGIIIMIFGHTINLALGLIGPFLHSLRLHYVEHFTKYYKGGGKEFKAFGVE
jgi:V/A-type H+-transporting ATPase subunit I